MLKVISGLVFVVCASVLVRGQFVPTSPCPDMFTYKSDGQRLHGVIRYQRTEHINSIKIIANFSVNALLPLPPQYSARMTLLGGRQTALKNFLRGEPLYYRVDFPITSPLPKVAVITVNNDIKCLGQPVIPGHGEALTTFSSSSIFSISSDTSGLPLIIRKPNPVFVSRPSNLATTTTAQNMSPSAGQGPFIIYRPTAEVPQQISGVPWASTPTWSQVHGQPPIPTSSTISNECGVVPSHVPLVFHGTSVKRGDWPWLTALYIKQEHNNIAYVCAGSLISNQHVLTAAHCMHDMKAVIGKKQFVVRIGAFNLDSWSDVVTRELKEALIHQSYNPNTLENDILLLTLDSPLDYTDYIRPICLWEGETNIAFISGQHGTVVSWGQSEISGGGMGEPRKATLPIVTNEVCRSSRIEFHKLTSENTLCAGDRNGTGPCNGDSGSGLFMYWGGRWRLRGIVSVSLRPTSGEARCNLDEYVVFTDVAQYLPWLTQHMFGL